ncbi:LOW QUALITY PROTEIN: UDP-glucuronosyltransferase 2C1-like [Hemitrygon akajei]|uniref:LOW QUALITY PROTEIN: UDP-glucuronosyltransferase 2C1-like n=1 Tax=Hemitrygon akajei TaxID=2704970 RepID=UPI003BF96C5C
MVKVSKNPGMKTAGNRLLGMAGLLLAVLAPGAACANILVVPVDGSHWINMRILMQELHARGHSLSVLHSYSSWYIQEDPTLYRSIIVRTTEKLGIVEDREMLSNLVLETLEVFRDGYTLLAFLRNNRNLHHMLTQTHEIVQSFIRQLFEDQQLMAKIKEAGFQLVLADSLFPTGAILAWHLGLPLVYNARWVTSGDCHQLLAPSPTSYVPVVGSRLSDSMTFSQRLFNTVLYFVSTTFLGVMVESGYEEICQQYLGPGTSLRQVTLAAEVWLMRVDFVLEFPRPTVPNMVYVGGFQCQPAQPLPAKLEEFVQGAGEPGVVLVSLGTLVTHPPDWLAETMATAFSRLPQRVIWRHQGARPRGLGNNTLVVEWLPQNDLLGHPKVVAFVTHGGTNGLYEAIYHGVPVVGLPLIFDQFDNMARLKARGAARVLDVPNLQADELEAAVRDVVEGPGLSYRRHMRHLSALHRDQQQTPLQRAIFWVEFVLRHGGTSHLRHAGLDLPWHVYHGLDVVAFLGGLAAGGLLLSILLIKRLCRALRRGKWKQE